MSFPPQAPVSILTFVAGVRTALGGFFHKVSEQAAKLRIRVQRIVNRLTEKLPPGQRQPVLIALTAFCAVFIALVFTGISRAGGSREGRQPVAATPSVRQGVIPPDDVFLPDEPDFVPGVLLEREQREKWTADDAAFLWQDPLKNGEEPWRNRIEKVIDDIMESVP